MGHRGSLCAVMTCTVQPKGKQMLQIPEQERKSPMQSHPQDMGNPIPSLAQQGHLDRAIASSGTEQAGDFLEVREHAFPYAMLSSSLLKYMPAKSLAQFREVLCRASKPGNEVSVWWRPPLPIPLPPEPDPPHSAHPHLITPLPTYISSSPPSPVPMWLVSTLSSALYQHWQLPG